MTFFPRPIFAICLLLGSYTCFANAQAEDNLQFSGFARVVMGYLDDSNAEYAGYDDSISLGEQSLLGLQADYQFNETLSITGQLVGHTNERRESGLEWLYVTYKPSNAFQVKLGKQRLPFFNYSDSLDVGFAYPWLTLPKQFYETSFFSTFEGLLANYEFPVSVLLINLEGYWGYYDDDIYSPDGGVETKVTGLFGFNTSVTWKNWNARASYNQGNTELTLLSARQFGEQLRQVGFERSADWLDPNGLIQFYQFSVNYEDLNYFLRSEIAKMEGESGMVPDIDSFYVSVGYNFYPYTIYLSYSKRDLYYDHPENEIPFGVSDQLNALAGGYVAVTNGFLDDKSAGTKVGIRWDWRSNVALKAEATYIDADEKISGDFTLRDLGNFDGSAILYQLGLEWVF